MEPATPMEIGPRVLPPSDRWSPALAVPAPVCRFENFLGAERAAALLEYAIAREEDFTAGTVLDPLTGQVSRKGRDSLVLPVTSEVFSAHLADCLPLVQEVLGHRAELVESLTVLTAHGEGGHFGIHTDASRVRDVSRALSAVYYLHRTPRGFGGGQLRLYDTVVDDGRARPGSPTAPSSPSTTPSPSSPPAPFTRWCRPPARAGGSPTTGSPSRHGSPAGSPPRSRRRAGRTPAGRTSGGGWRTRPKAPAPSTTRPRTTTEPGRWPCRRPAPTPAWGRAVSGPDLTSLSPAGLRPRDGRRRPGRSGTGVPPGWPPGPSGPRNGPRSPRTTR